jgi:hypothetical protein
MISIRIGDDFAAKSNLNPQALPEQAQKQLITGENIDGD